MPLTNPLSIGSFIYGGTSTAIPYIDSNGKLAQAVTNGLIYDAVNNRVGIGINSPLVEMHVQSNTSIAFVSDLWVASNQGAGLLARKGRGSISAPRRVQSGDSIGIYNARGAFAADDSSTASYSSGNVGEFRFVASEAYTSTARGTHWFLATTPIGTTTLTERIRVTDVGIIKVGGTANRGTTEGVGSFRLFNGTNPVGTLTNGIDLYSSGGELFVIDAGGTATQLSPHKNGKWVFNSVHTVKKKKLLIEVEKILRFIDKQYNLNAVHEEVA